MALENKDGCVWLMKVDGGFMISTIIPGITDLKAMDHLRLHFQKAGFEGEDEPTLHYKEAGALQIDITLRNAGMTLLEVDLYLKSFVSCIRDSGIIRNPIISRINDRLARLHQRH